MAKYIIHGTAGNLPPCNVNDKWGGNFKFDMQLTLPCGCKIYTGELAIAQENNWPNRISHNNDFSFELICVCGTSLIQGESASDCQDVSGWPYLF